MPSLYQPRPSVTPSHSRPRLRLFGNSIPGRRRANATGGKVGFELATHSIQFYVFCQIGFICCCIHDSPGPGPGFGVGGTGYEYPFLFRSSHKQAPASRPWPEDRMPAAAGAGEGSTSASGSRRRRRRRAASRRVRLDTQCRRLPGVGHHGYRPPRARRRSAGRGERLCRAASRHWPQVEQGPQAAHQYCIQVARRRRVHLVPCRQIGSRRACDGGGRRRPSSGQGRPAGAGHHLLEGGKGSLAVGQSAELLPRVDRRVEACQVHHLAVM